MKQAVLVTAFFLLLFSCKKDIIPGTGGGGGNKDTIIVTPPASYKLVSPKPLSWDNNKRGTMCYQLLVYAFADSDRDGIGDFKGLTDKLDYIDNLGATAIWLSPIHPAMSYHGYDVLDYSAVNSEYGSMDDFKTLIAEAHKRDIKIYLDYVLNHTGSKHPWFLDAQASVTSPYRDFYIFSDNPSADITAGKIPMIATEGAAGYDKGQWFASATETTGFLEFVLDWTKPSAPTITVNRCGDADADNTAPASSTDRFLYFGDAVCKKFYQTGSGTYKLKVNFSSSWGFLIRTNNSSWDLGTKYGAKNASDVTITYGKPFTLYTSTTNNDNVLNILMPGSSFFHSHFWTDWFADLNYGAVDTAQRSGAYKAVTESAKKWIDAGVDGFRLDAVKHIYHNATSKENPQFLKLFYDDLNAYFRKSHSEDLFMVGEQFAEYSEVAPYYAGLPAMFEFSFWYRLSYALQKSIGCYFAKDILSYLPVYAGYRSDYIEATKLSNHDENRARSDLNNSLPLAKLAGAVLLTSGGTPFVYSGEELGYTGKKDQGGDEYVRQPILWGDNYVTNYTSKIDLNLAKNIPSIVEQEKDSTSILSLYRNFARVRNRYPALASGKMEAHLQYNENRSSDFPGLAVWYMTKDSEKLLVIHNFSATSLTFPISDNIKDAIVCNGKVYVKKENNLASIRMEGLSSVVFAL